MLSNSSIDKNIWVKILRALEEYKTSRGILAGDIEKAIHACIAAVTTSLQKLVALSRAPPSSWNSLRSSAAVELKDLVQPYVELLEACISVDPALCRAAFASILNIPSGTTSANFVDVYFPLLKAMPKVLQKYDLTIVSSPFDELAQELIALYLHHVLHTSTVSRHPDIRILGCGCEDCKHLDSFMVGPETQQLLRFPGARRIHVEGRVRDASDLVSYTIIESGSPYGIKITKLPHVVVVGHWTVRVKYAKMFLRMIGNETVLQKLMGDRYANVLLALGGKKQFSAGGSSPTHASASHDPSNPPLHEDTLTPTIPTNSDIPRTLKRKH